MLGFFKQSATLIFTGLKIHRNSFYLDGDALEWCRLLLRNEQLIGWKNYAEKAKGLLKTL